jgi:hypothetical protein
MKYLLKCLTSYEFEADNDTEAIKMYEEGYLSDEHMTEEIGLSIQKYTDKKELTTIKEY